jgi:cation transport ATPase
MNTTSQQTGHTSEHNHTHNHHNHHHHHHDHGHKGQTQQEESHRAHNAHQGHGHNGHGGHDHGVMHEGHITMMRNRFWVSLPLTIIVVLYSGMIQQWFGFSMPEFTGSEYIAPLLGSIIFFYGGLPFLDMARQELPSSAGHDDPDFAGDHDRLCLQSWPCFSSRLLDEMGMASRVDGLLLGTGDADYRHAAGSLD